MANLKEKLSVQVVAISSIKSEQASLFTIITSLKYSSKHFNVRSTLSLG